MTIKDSGQRTEYENGFVRDMHEGKGRMDLLPWRAIIEVAKHCEEGAKKYGERNIDLGCPQHSLIDSAFRHLAKYTVGMNDEDHLRACAWNILWALEQQVHRPDMQDIPARIERALIEKDLELRTIRDRACVELTCFNNTGGVCMSTSDTWEPTHGQQCPDFSED